MNIKAVERLMAMLPEGPKKEALRQKLNKFSTKSVKRGGDGLQDSFEFKPKGHITIEAIDEGGNVVGTLADQPNLVVHGAEEIMLRAFSGDPNRILYKNRVPKQATTQKYFIEESKLAGLPFFDGSQLQHAPNLLWSMVKDEDFEISYGYFPVTAYVKEEVTTEHGKKAFSFSKAPAAGYLPMNAEIYSTYTNLFIGIGEGKYYNVPLTDSRFTYSAGFAPVDGVAKTTTVGHEVKFKQKISNFAIEFEASNKGAQIDVFINGVLKETIETLDSNLSEPETRIFEYNELNNETETEVKFVHSGSDSQVSNPVMTITGISFDALTKEMNSLIKEFKNFETDFFTPSVYNTTPMGPFTVQIPNCPVKEGSEVISYNDIKFTKVATPEELTDTTYTIDYMRGIVRFNRALTGIGVTYSVTGEIYDSELVSTMTAGTVTYSTTTEPVVTGQTVSGAANGYNKNFTLTHPGIKENTLVVKVNNVAVTVSTFNPATRAVVLANAPASGATVTADYTYVNTVVTNIATNKYATPFVMNDGTLKVFDHNGVEMTLVERPEDFGDGKYMLDETKKLVILSQKDIDGTVIPRNEFMYRSDERPGVPTNYSRAVIQKPKTVNEYPWFELDRGSVRFVAEFKELNPAHNITIREMGLFDGPRVEDNVPGFRKYPVKAFSLVRVGETRKDTNTGIRVTWTITLLNDQGQAFQGGRA